MERFKKCVIRLDRDKVIRLVNFKYGSVKQYAKEHGISRVRFYQILNEPHLSKNVESLQKLASNLDVSIETILL